MIRNNVDSRSDNRGHDRIGLCRDAFNMWANEVKIIGILPGEGRVHGYPSLIGR